MKLIRYLTIAFLSLMLTGCASKTNETVSAVKRIIESHPESTLQDVYKSYYQDRFGPGHMIASRDGAENYFDSELEECTDIVKGNGYEPTGDSGSYVRVDMELVKAGIIDRGTLLEAFISSAKAPDPEALLRWTDEWHHIVAELDKAGGLGLEGYESDKAMIEEVLSQDGDHAIHHSERFSAAYDPHYRIVEKDKFESLILPLLEN